LNHLCQWQGCQRAAHPEVPVKVSLCGHHWVEVGQAYAAHPMFDLAREIRDDARYWTPPKGFPRFCYECGWELLVDTEDSTLVCSSAACTYRQTPEKHQELVELKRAKNAILGREKYAAMQAELKAGRQHAPLVYYIRFGDRIKIGTTIDMKHRMASLPHDEILAVEPGSYWVENRRHRQFAKHRITGEWFSMAPELMSYIEWIAKMHPFGKFEARPRKAA
jgi:hypothetical protein